MKSARWLVVAALLVGLSGCKDHPKPAAAPPLVESPTPPTETPAPSCLQTPCPQGQVCGASGCRSCRIDTECGADQKCCGGSCEFAECCGNGDCLGRLCKAGTCQPCQADPECGAGQVCCAGLCKAGACCADAQCPAGQRCRNHKCGGCEIDVDCQAGEKCCAGACVQGTCCRSADCPGEICLDHQCAACTDDAQCAAGKACCKGQCVVEGTCELGFRLTCSDADAGGPACANGRKCCSGKCIAAQCCGDDDCKNFPATPSCIDGACAACTSDAQCGAGKKCCGGSCHPGECCPGQICSNGQACLAYACGSCNIDSDCGIGKRCCKDDKGVGLCRDGACCGNSDCNPYVCYGGQCGACLSDSDCGDKSRCCNGACVVGAGCCSRVDCPGGQVCSADHRCVGCVNKRQCGEFGRCCNNTCSLGTCCSNDDCNTKDTGLVCGPSGACQLCLSDAQCGGPGHKCCGGRCVSGGCCLDTECPAGRKCVNYGCGACTTTGPNDIRGNCGTGQVCCGPDGNKSCQTGTCCGNTDCTANQLVCDGFTCKFCVQGSATLSCSAGSLCCQGVCYPGAACCTDVDCGGQRCVNGKCNACQTDPDCGSNMYCCPANDPARPKLCKSFCETTQTSDTPDDWKAGNTDGTFQGPSELDPDCIAGRICLSGKASHTDTSYIWIPVSGLNKVYHYNADTLQLLSTTTVYGTDPSRTAVNTSDNSIWVGSRGFSGASGVTHIDMNGNVICWKALPKYTRAVALDSHYDVWAGSCGDGTMQKISGSQVDKSTNPPTCVSLNTSVKVSSGCAYGAASDARNHIWVTGLSEFDGNSAAPTELSTRSTPGWYGMTVDSQYAWVGAYSGSCVYRCSLTTTEACIKIPTGSNPRGLSVSTDDYVYSGSNGPSIFIIPRKSPGNFLTVYPLDENGAGFSSLSSWGTITTAVDGAGRVWLVDYAASKATRYCRGDNCTPPVTGQDCSPDGQNTACQSHWCWLGKCAMGKTITYAGNAYAYTDLTGVQSIIAHVPPGYWTGTYDSALSDPAKQPYWSRVDLKAKIPVDTSVGLRVRVALDATAFSGANQAPWYPDLVAGKPAYINVPSTNPSGFATYSIPIIGVDTALNVRARRFLQIEYKLATNSDQASPVLDASTVVWSPPDPK